MSQPPGSRPDALTCLPVDGVGEVAAGADLAAVLLEAVTPRRTVTSWWSPARW